MVSVLVLAAWTQRCNWGRVAAGAQDSGLWPGPPGGHQRPTGHCLGYDSTGASMDIMTILCRYYGYHHRCLYKSVKMYDRKWWPILMCELFVFDPTFLQQNSIGGIYFYSKISLVADIWVCEKSHLWKNTATAVHGVRARNAYEQTHFLGSYVIYVIQYKYE